MSCIEMSRDLNEGTRGQIHVITLNNKGKNLDQPTTSNNIRESKLRKPRPSFNLRFKFAFSYIIKACQRKIADKVSVSKGAVQ